MSKGRSNVWKLRDIINVKDPEYGAKGDNATNDSAAIQLAIDAANARGGAIVVFPDGEYLCSNLVLKSGVWLLGAGQGYLASGTAAPVNLRANAAGVVIDTPNGSNASNCGIEGINIAGLGAGTAVKGIRFRDVDRGQIKNVNINNCSDEGLLVDSTSIACVFEDILALNCLMSRTQAVKTGVIDIDGTDHFLNRIEATASLLALSSANAYLCGFVIRGDNNFFDNLIGEISDEGIHLTAGASLNRFNNCRADLNYGHGWNVIGASNQFANCSSINNGQETTNTYDGWLFDAASGNNQTANCQASSTTAKVHRYGFNDQLASATTKNTHFNPRSFGAATQPYINNNSNGSGMEFCQAGLIGFTGLDTTPSVAGFKNFQTNNSAGATTITNFDDGVNGQHIYVLVADNNTTFQHNGVTMTLPGAANIVGVVQTIYHFVRTGGVWRVVGGA